jgi:hypothetical protein
MLRQSFNYASLLSLCLVIAGCGSASPVTSEETAQVSSALSTRPLPISRTGKPLPVEPGVSRTLSEIVNADKRSQASPYSYAPPHVAPAALIGPPAGASGSGEALAAAEASAASPAPSASFLAAEDSGWIPPDTNGAVGPNHLVVALNGRVRFQTRTGQTLNDFTLAGFFSPVSGAFGDVFDPLVRFDSLGSRFVMTAMADRKPAIRPEPGASSGSTQIPRISAGRTFLKWASTTTGLRSAPT